MDKRSVLALFLILVVIVAGTMVQARLSPRVADSTLADTLHVDTTRAPATATAAAQPAAAKPDTTKPAAPLLTAAPPAGTPSVPAETTTVAAKGREMHFVSAGASLASVTLPEFKDLKRREGTLVLAPNAGTLLRYRIANGADTIRLDRLTFTKSLTPSGVEYASASPAVRVRYDVDSVNYLTHATVSLAGAAPDARLLVDLPSDLASGEANEKEDLRALAYAYRPKDNDVESKTLARLDTTWQVEQGPIDWVAVRNKYFVTAVMSTDSTHQFAGFVMKRGPVRPDGNPTGIATASLPLSAAGARFDLYTGPQTWKTLRTVGHELSNVNPYGGWAWLRPVVDPFSTIVMRMLLGMKALVGLSYGWVLVIFGVLVRLLLWPLNQTAMRTSIKMQAIQPELTALQKRYANDPEAQRTAMMKLYSENGMSPLSPLMGCLPMLIPMPILMALYFVFQNTIEFRGVPFLWLPDIALKDPYYITPIVMGVSMFVLSMIGMRAAPANPQAKIMGYMMPAMMTMIFLNFASGLNLYYAVQNLIAIPQQWLLTQERQKAAAVTAAKGAPAVKPRK
jgi:YidC/Oxa1 family membrane protein insertase